MGVCSLSLSNEPHCLMECCDFSEQNLKYFHQETLLPIKASRDLFFEVKWYWSRFYVRKKFKLYFQYTTYVETNKVLIFFKCLGKGWLRHWYILLEVKNTDLLDFSCGKGDFLWQNLHHYTSLFRRKYKPNLNSLFTVNRSGSRAFLTMYSL